MGKDRLLRRTFLDHACRMAALLVMVWGGVAGAAGADQAWPPAGVSLYGDVGVPDVSGLWLGTFTGVPGEAFAPNRGSADGRSATFWSPWPLPYTPQFQAIYDQRVAAAKNGKVLSDGTARCLPFGLPMMLVSKVYPDEIVQTPGEVTFFMNSTQPVVIWTDGRGHPRDLQPSYNGHSIGHWLGDTLVVDTVGIVAGTSLDNQRDPHSGALHLRWTLQKVAPDVLHLHVTMDDPLAFTEPVTTTNIWHRQTQARWQVLDDASCYENNASGGGSVTSAGPRAGPSAGPGAGFIKF